MTNCVSHDIRDGVHIHIFHRDLRIVDNTALISASANHPIIPIFIFDNAQIREDRNVFYNTNSIQFMCESLIDLNSFLLREGTYLRLYQGEYFDCLNTAIKESGKNVLSIGENMDYTPFAKERQRMTLKYAEERNLRYIICEDIYLNNPGRILNGSGDPYQKFTPFYEASKRKPVAKPVRTSPKWAILPEKPNRTHSDTDIIEMINRILPSRNNRIHARGGRRNALQILTALPGIVAHYDNTRDIPSIETSNLAAHNHFGTVSIREVYWSIKGGHKATEFIRQLYWRDFYGHICAFCDYLYHYSPYMVRTVPGAPTVPSHFPYPKDDRWVFDVELFDKWATGRTGHELIDAGMHQLVLTGYMHNRVRLLCADYLTKTLKVYWKWGEYFFAKHLIDYDYAQNFGNWCWVASILPFGSAPFRKLNPDRQLRDYDNDRQYVKKWL